MPHLHDDKQLDVDNASHTSTRSGNADTKSVCPVAESAANQLLSLATMGAKKHDNSKPSSEPQNQEELDLTSQNDDETLCLSPSSSSTAVHASRPSFEESRRMHPRSPGPSPRWGVASPYPRFHAFARHSPMHRVHSGSPIVDHPIRYMPGGRGGFPMWAPRPPYRPPPIRDGCPSPLPSAFQRPMYMHHQVSSNDDDSCKSNGRISAVKRPSLGYPTKSILKKSRVETSEASSTETKSTPGDEEVASDLVKHSISKTVSCGTEGEVCTEDNEEGQAGTSHGPVIVNKSSDVSEDGEAKRQRIISPASSNEYPRSTLEDDEPSPELRGRFLDHETPVGPDGVYFHPGIPFRMGHPNPAMQGMRCGPHHPGGRFMPPPVAMYPHHAIRPHPPLSMQTATGPGMYPPRNMSARGRPGFGAMPPLFARPRMRAPPTPPSPSLEQSRHTFAAEKSSQSHLPSPPVTSSGPPSSTTETLTDVSGSANRCIPLSPPVPAKYWSDADTLKEVILPDFHRLVNFPDLLAKGRNGSGDSGADGGSPNALGSKKRCVMCGKLRVSATYIRAKKANADDAAEGCSDSGCMSGAESSHIIPRQNKGVCTACDVTVWVALELDGLEIKWCKGCKNFRPWSHFGEKSLATKCLRCRDRQKEKYAMQKNSSSRRRINTGVVEEKKTSDDNDIQQNSLAEVAAHGLRALS